MLHVARDRHVDTTGITTLYVVTLWHSSLVVLCSPAIDAAARAVMQANYMLDITIATAHCRNAQNARHATCVPQVYRPHANAETTHATMVR
jgi:hypothetical protein